ncbi:MAG: hypothetical protein JNK60_00585 [Acidobacteria bacterium]|nr:hypothetical protein [Acidobacteriota bacterium]
MSFVEDLEAARIYRRGLAETVRYASSRTDLFPPEQLPEKRLLDREHREALWSIWQTFLDYELALGNLGRNASVFDEEHEEPLLVFASTLFARYRFAMAFIELAERDPSLHVVLNEAIPELGLPAGTYADLKLRFLNALRAAEFGAIEALLAVRGGTSYPEVRAGIHEDSDEIVRMGFRRGPVLTAKNAVSVLKAAGFAAWFPVQTKVADLMGDLKVYRQDRCLITEAQIQAALPRLEPGDIFLERREWFLSNVGLPGFWPHAALYLGTAGERTAFFGDDSFETDIALRHPEAARNAAIPEAGHPRRVLEATGEGVVFTSLEHSASADSWAVLRPRLSKADRRAALLRAFRFAGRPYDFNFDFLTDDAIVCSELVYKAYRPGLDLPLLDILGRKAMPPNELARLFDAEAPSPSRQLDLVLFLDGSDRRGGAEEAGEDAFRASWKRPKWHTLTSA